MKTIAVVPMKLNNTRLPQKNTKKFKDGHPLCWYILTTLLNCEIIDDVYVYCSNSDICEYIPSDVHYLKRDVILDQDSTKMNEVLAAFARDVFADVYVMAHATAPFVSIKSFERGIEAVVNNGYDSAFTVKKLQDFIWKDGKPFNYKLDSIPRTQDLEPLYIETSGYYIYKRNVIVEDNRRIGNKPYLVEVNEIESSDIDVYNDFFIADAIQYYKQHEDVIYEG